MIYSKFLLKRTKAHRSKHVILKGIQNFPQGNKNILKYYRSIGDRYVCFGSMSFKLTIHFVHIDFNELLVQLNYIMVCPCCLAVVRLTALKDCFRTEFSKCKKMQKMLLWISKELHKHLLMWRNWLCMEIKKSSPSLCYWSDSHFLLVHAPITGTSSSLVNRNIVFPISPVTCQPPVTLYISLLALYHRTEQQFSNTPGVWGLLCLWGKGEWSSQDCTALEGNRSCMDSPKAAAVTWEFWKAWCQRLQHSTLWRPSNRRKYWKEKSNVAKRKKGKRTIRNAFVTNNDQYS